jgi:UDP:flavonoid glycosyltransferase YjiC (YdhE family)
MSQTQPSIAYFITPHGFGHASRAAAVMQAALDLLPDAYFHLYTTVPRWFFEDSLPPRFEVHECECDIGLVQNGPMEEDLPATVERLGQFLPFKPGLIQHLSGELTCQGCQLVLCDIAPVGFLAAHAASLPCVLIENFTWDWIYTGYVEEFPAFESFIRLLQQTFSAADHHLQCEPVCSRDERAHLFSPISRRVTISRPEVRQRLGISPGEKVVLVSMGGVRTNAIPRNADHLPRGITFLVPGGSKKIERRENLILLPWRAPVSYPDIVNACDAVVGKSGYSTLAEVYHAGIPYGYISRPKFRESPVLADFITSRMQGLEIPPEAFQDGSWTDLLPQLLDLPRLHRQEQNGSVTTARWLMTLL